MKREQVRRRKERWGWLLEKKRNGGSKGADESASEGGAASIEEEKEALEEDTGSDGMRTSAANHFQTAGVLEFNNDLNKDDEVMALKQYDYFGERALLNSAPRAASVKAVTPMKLLQISKAHFEEVLGSLETIIDSHRRRREEGARRAYLQRQAEGLLDASPHEFVPVHKVVTWSCRRILWAASSSYCRNPNELMMAHRIIRDKGFVGAMDTAQFVYGRLTSIHP